MPSKKKKGYALELVDDPVIKHNFDMVVQQIQSIKDSLRCGGYKTSDTDTGVGQNFDTTSFTDVPQLHFNYKSYGNPVFIGLQPKYADNSYAATMTAITLLGGFGTTPSLTMKLFRDGNVIAEVLMGTAAFAIGPANRVNFPPSIFWYLDQPKGGEHQYKIQVVGGDATVRVSLTYVRLVAFEIPMALLT